MALDTIHEEGVNSSQHSNDKTPNTMEIAGDKQVEIIQMSEIPYRIHVKIPRTDKTSDVCSGVQQFARAVKAVDHFATFSSTIGENVFNQPANVPTNGKILGIFKNRTNKWRGRRDVAIYVLVRTRVTVGAINESPMFQQLNQKGV